MNGNAPKQKPETEQRIAALISRLRETELELQALTAGQFTAARVLQSDEAQKVTEMARAWLQHQQHSILDSVGEGIYGLDAEGRIIFGNQVTAAILGWNQQEIFGQYAHLLLHHHHSDGETYDLQDCPIHRTLRDGQVRRIENEVFFRKDGSSFPVAYVCSPMRDDESGAITGAMVCFRDISERRRAQDAVRTQAAWIESAQRIGQMGIWDLNLQTRQLVWSESTCHLFGITPGEFKETLEHFQSFILPEDRHLCEAVHARVIPTSPLLEAEYRIRRPDGQIRWMYERGNVQFDPAGNQIRRLGVVMDITETRAAREKLEWSTTLQRIAGKAARLGGWAIELPGHKLTWSDETCAIHDQPPGYQPNFGEGVSMFPPEYREEVARKVKACAEEGIPYDFELPKITAKGRRIWVRSMGEAVRDVSGKIIRLQGAFQDITERKQAELNLFKSNRALRLLRACSEALTRMADEKQLLVEVCQLAVEIGDYRMAWVGYAQDDESHLILPMAHAGEEQGYLSKMEFTWSEDSLFGRGPAGEAIRSGQSVVCEDITKHPAIRDYLDEVQTRGYRGVICLPLRNENRAFGLLTLYSTQVLQPGDDELKLLHELADDLAFGIKSLRARAESRIAEQKIAQQAALLDQARDAIFVRDFENRVLFWNKGAERVYGWNAAEVLNRSISEFLFPEQPADVPASEALLQKGEWAGELRRKTKAGHSITVDCRWTLVRDEHQQPNSVLCIETDITEKKQLEANFLRAQRMESIGTLAGGIAHDLNNVFAPILMSITLLKMNLHDEESKDVLQTLQSSAQRGAELVKQVLSFARGVEGERIEVNPVHLLRELGIVVRDTFPKSIVFDLRDKLDLRTVTGDPTQLHQIFLNLCVNARDAMPDGGVLMVKLQNVVLDAKTAAMNPDAHPGAYVAVQVSDSGSGIAPEIRERIFEPFFTTKEFGKGTGLGLSTTLAIVKSHGGFINVNSEAGKGTTFTVYLPANTRKAQPEKVVVNKPLLPAGDGELILVVDDEKSIRRIAQHTLERVGYRVLLAGEGAEALALYAQHSEEIAVVLTDMAMPVMDGPSLIIALRALNPKARIIGSSGLTSAEGLARAVGKGVRHFIPKPYTAELLLKTLHEALNDWPDGKK